MTNSPNGLGVLIFAFAVALIAANYWWEGRHMTHEPRPPRHENHDQPGADITDCPACRNKANAIGVDW